MPTLIDDTIAAISTPLGKGGLGVIRLSGKDSCRILLSLFPSGQNTLVDRVPLLGNIIEPKTGEILDQAIVTFFKSPRSFTREDVVEISCHGSPVVLKAVLRLLLDSGARLATPGEFTMRAFLRGRIDLVQAEAIHDLVEAQTLFQAKVANQQASGSLSRRLKPIKESLVQMISLMEAGIDFAEDDVSVLSDEVVRKRLQIIKNDLKTLYASFAAGKLITTGMSIAIVGRPNVGKSSLFNALLQDDRAIVTDTPGTTRDLISETIQIDGIPVRFIDTAGIREAENRVERIGIDKSLEAVADADRTLLVMDGSEFFTEPDQSLCDRLQGYAYTLVVNKIDLPCKLDLTPLRANPKAIFEISAKTGEGIRGLKQGLFEESGRVTAREAEEGLITNVRHENLIGESIQSLDRAEKSLEAQMPHEALLLDFYACLKSLNELTGETTVEDILGNIFSTFCIGK